VNWYSKLQTITTDSTAYSEYLAIYENTKEVEVQRQILAGILLAEPFPTLVFNDNFAADRILRKEQPSGNHRHFDQKYHYSKTRIGVTILPMHVESKANVADHFTKPLSKNEFIKHVATLADPSTLDIQSLVNQGLTFRKYVPEEYKHLQQ